jgi:hypothetical protein
MTSVIPIRFIRMAFKGAVIPSINSGNRRFWSARR